MSHALIGQKRSQPRQPDCKFAGMDLALVKGSRSGLKPPQQQGHGTTIEMDGRTELLTPVTPVKMVTQQQQLIRDLATQQQQQKQQLVQQIVTILQPPATTVLSGMDPAGSPISD